MQQSTITERREESKTVPFWNSSQNRMIPGQSQLIGMGLEARHDSVGQERGRAVWRDGLGAEGDEVGVMGGG